mgnify:FL=1
MSLEVTVPINVREYWSVRLSCAVNMLGKLPATLDKKSCANKVLGGRAPCNTPM